LKKKLSGNQLSVVIPAYNSEKYLVYTLQSIANQTVQPSQIIVVNDCSTDRTRESAVYWGEAFKLPIEIVDHSVNQGIGATRQTGVENSDGKYIAFLSSDDAWHPRFLEKSLKTLTPDSASFTDYYRCTDELIPYGYFQVPYFKDHKEFLSQTIKFALNKNMFVNFSCIIFPKWIFQKCRFQSELRHGEDLIFLLDCVIQDLKIRCVREPLLYYRIHPKQGTRLIIKDEWLKLWRYNGDRLRKLGVNETIIQESYKKNYGLFYPKMTLNYAIKKILKKIFFLGYYDDWRKYGKLLTYQLEKQKTQN